MCPTGVVIVGGLADFSAMGSCVHCIQSRVSMSRRRRRRRFPAIKSHACMARGLLVRQSLAIGVFSLIGHTTSIRAVVCLRLPVAIYVLFDAPAYRRFCGCMQCIYIFYLLVCL